MARILVGVTGGISAYKAVELVRLPTQANIAKLAERGARIVPPGVGALASKGEFGVGRLAEPPDIAAAIEEALQSGFTPHSLDGLRVLVTAGGTREPIDAVRYVGNRSS